MHQSAAFGIVKINSHVTFSCLRIPSSITFPVIFLLQEAILYMQRCLKRLIVTEAKLAAELVNVVHYTDLSGMECDCAVRGVHYVGGRGCLLVTSMVVRR
jgi:hypothetical protein